MFILYIDFYISGRYNEREIDNKELKERMKDQ